MEPQSKRKAAAAMSPENDARAAKRQRLQGHTSGVAETPESATGTGLKFVEAVRQAKDKTGRHIATDFLTLPDKRQYPQYYQQILLPIALDTIETKLNRREYANLAAVESDVKRMVANAKAFNEKSSSIYDDAERIRKTAFNWMVKHNPAYKSPNYVAIATPVPTESTNGNVAIDGQEGNAAGDASERPRRAAPVSQPTPQPARSKRSSEREPAARGQSEGPEFTGKTFQQAQDQIMSEMIKYKDPESELEIFSPFVNLPSRMLTDYYQLTKYPVSLRSVQKKVRGIHGRNPPTNVTDFKSWDAYEEEVSFIWRNARQYNEDGSEMYNLAGEFEDVFKQRLAEAKAKVEQPTQPTLKLKMSAPKQSIKLRFGGSKDSPAPQSGPGTPAGRDSSTPGVIVDSGALARQQQHVAAGMNGQMAPLDVTAQAASSRNQFSGSRSGSATTPIPSVQPPADETQATSAASPPLAPNGVKSESQPRQSPALNSIRPSSAAPERSSVPTQTPQLAASAMPPPPSIAPRPPSASPHPQSHPSQLQNSNHSHGLPPHNASPSGFEIKHRAPGRTAADALLPVLTINSHPQLKLQRPYKISIPASPTLNEQSVTLTLPSMYHDLQFVPTLPVAVTSRPYRLFVTMNGFRMSEVVRPGGEKEKGKPLFEARLKAGEVTRFDVEVLAATPVAASPSKGRGLEKEQVEWEKCTVFVYLMRTGYHVDGLRFAGGSFSLFTETKLRELIDLAHSHGVYVSTGGWMEHVPTQSNTATTVDRYLQKCNDVGFDVVEISTGFLSLPPDDWLRLVDKVRSYGIKAKPEIGIQFSAGGNTEASDLRSVGTSDPSKVTKIARRFVDAGVERVMSESEGVTDNVKSWRTDVIQAVSRAAHGESHV